MNSATPSTASAEPTPPPVHPLLALAAAAVLAVPIGLLADWMTAVHVLVTVLALLTGQRQP